MAPNKSPWSLQSAWYLAVAELIIPWLLWLIKPIRSITAVLVLIRFLYKVTRFFRSRTTESHVTQRSRSWCAPPCLPLSIDLQKLCDLYHGEGEMGLPREVIDEIMHYNDPQTLEKCSLTSRAFYSAARPLIHRRIALGRASLIRGSPLELLPVEAYFEQADAFHARYLSMAEELGLLRYGYVKEVDLNLRIGTPENILQLQQLRALESVHTLTVHSLDLRRILPIFDRCFSQFVPTLRSLRLKLPDCENASQLIEFVCQFPHLDDLALLYPCKRDDLGLAPVPTEPGGPRQQQSLPFGGDLVLYGMGPVIRCLLDLPGGVRFRSIEADSHLKDLAKLLVACRSTLEVLRIRCFENLLPKSQRLREASTNWGSGEMLSVHLGRNGVLRRFELDVDFAELDVLPPFLHEALTSISSPHFSEFSLRLFKGMLPELTREEGAGDRKTSWGTGWEMVDEDLYAHAARKDDFRFVVNIVVGESTEADVEALFPRMKSKGSLLVTTCKL